MGHGLISAKVLAQGHTMVAARVRGPVGSMGKTMSGSQEIQPLDNLWALDFGNEASKPFASIRIQLLGRKIPGEW